MEQNFGINNVTVHPGIIKAHGNQATNCKECDRLGMRHVQGREEMYCAIWWQNLREIDCLEDIYIDGR